MRARVLAAGVLTAGAVVIAPAAPAYADVWKTFEVCAPSCDYGLVDGTVIFYNRTADVNGLVYDVGTGSTTAVFEAYAGAKKIDSETRTANDDPGSSLGSPRLFDFAIGDPNLVGGIDRIKITVCFDFNLPNQWCGPPTNVSKF
jgi:hypothetical protein